MSNPAPSISVPALFKLPAEIVQQILAKLEVQHLVSLLRTCRELKQHAEVDSLWLDLLRQNIPEHDLPLTPSPALSYQQLYLAHHPRWHLPRHKIWFSDDAYYGKLILVKFDPLHGSINGYRIAAEKPPVISQRWSYKPSVIIHQVNPRVYASTEDPVIRMTPDRLSNPDQSPHISSEVRMRVGQPNHHISASLMLSKDLPCHTASSPSVSVWPPRTVPDMARTRSSTASMDKFTSKGHKPASLSEISQTSFRLRTWSHFTQGMLSLGVRIGEEVSTWSTLHSSLYTPTPTKPYQGVYVGDYASHGCEFLLVLQTDCAPPLFPASSRPARTGSDSSDSDGDGDATTAAARHRAYTMSMLAGLRERGIIDERDEADMLSETPYATNASTVPTSSQYSKPTGPVYSSSTTTTTPNVPNPPKGVIHQGALAAIKITGDVNVPRGEHTFIADDISDSGTIRIAHEAPFTGARVVRSRGHVAGRGFRDDEYIPSQLFLINENTLAQYWLPFGHISFYHRVDIDGVLKLTQRDNND